MDNKKYNPVEILKGYMDKNDISTSDVSNIGNVDKNDLEYILNGEEFDPYLKIAKDSGMSVESLIKLSRITKNIE